MVVVGGRTFPDTKKGNQDAKEYANRTGQTVRQKNSKPIRRQRGR